MQRALDMVRRTRLGEVPRKGLRRRPCAKAVGEKLWTELLWKELLWQGRGFTRGAPLLRVPVGGDCQADDDVWVGEFGGLGGHVLANKGDGEEVAATRHAGCLLEGAAQLLRLQQAEVDAARAAEHVRQVEVEPVRACSGEMRGDHMRSEEIAARSGS